MADRILVEGLRVPVALGVTPGERALARPVAIDLALEADLAPAGRSDRLEQTIDYAEVYRVVTEVADAREYALVETLAERLAAVLLERFPIEAVELSVLKLAPVSGALERAGVKIRRARGV